MKSDWPTAAIATGLCVAVLHVVLGPNIQATVGTLYDDIVYLSLGKALAEGEGFRSIHLVGAPVHSKFPPLLPAVYAVLWATTHSLRAVVFGAYGLSMLVLALGTAGIWRYGERLQIRWWILTFFAIGPLLLLRTVRYFAGAVSEPWFVLGWGASLLLAADLGRSGEGSAPEYAQRRRPLTTALVLGLLLAATVLARTQAIVLIPAILLALVVRRTSARLIGACTAAALLPLAAWRIWHGRMLDRGPVSTSLDQAPYLEWILGDSPRETMAFLSIAARANLPEYLAHAGRMLIGWTSWKAEAIVLGCAFLTVAGLVMALRKRPELTLTVLAVSAVLVVWPFNQARFLTTLLPFAGLAAALAAERIYVLTPPLGRKTLMVGLAGLTLVLSAYNFNQRSKTYRFQESIGSLPVGMAEAAKWIEASTEPSDYILADYSAVYFLRTGRQTSIGFPEQPFTAPSVLNPEGRYLARRLLADSADYVVDARPSEGRIAPQVVAIEVRCPGVLRPIAPVPVGDHPGPRYYEVTRDEDCLIPLSNEFSTYERALLQLSR